MADVDDGKADDYEYDEAHETPDATTTPIERPPSLRPPSGMQVSDDAGDYSYDAAHDRA